MCIRDRGWLEGSWVYGVVGLAVDEMEVGLVDDDDLDVVVGPVVFLAGRGVGEGVVVGAGIDGFCN